MTASQHPVLSPNMANVLNEIAMGSNRRTGEELRLASRLKPRAFYKTLRDLEKLGLADAARNPHLLVGEERRGDMIYQLTHSGSEAFLRAPRQASRTLVQKLLRRPAEIVAPE